MYLVVLKIRNVYVCSFSKTKIKLNSITFIRILKYIGLTYNVVN